MATGNALLRSWSELENVWPLVDFLLYGENKITKPDVRL